MFSEPAQCCVLSQAGDLRELGRAVLPWAVMLFVAVFVLGRVVRVRRYVRGRDKSVDGEAKSPWTFQQLREMHARGELGDAEFELLKVRAIADAADRQLWTLEDLRGMHARGELADDEFELAKARLIAAVNPDAGAGLGNEADGPSGPRRPA